MKTPLGVVRNLPPKHLAEINCIGELGFHQSWMEITWK